MINTFLIYEYIKCSSYIYLYTFEIILHWKVAVEALTKIGQSGVNGHTSSFTALSKTTI